MKGVVFLSLFIVLVSPTYGRVICEQFATSYTYCETGYSCCYDNQYCCKDSVVIQNVTNEAGLHPGVIAAIVLSSIVLVLLLGIIGVYVYKQCNKNKRTVSSGRRITHVSSVYVLNNKGVQPGVNVVPLQNFRQQPSRGHGGAGHYAGPGYGTPMTAPPSYDDSNKMSMERGMPPQYTPFTN